MVALELKNSRMSQIVGQWLRNLRGCLGLLVLLSLLAAHPLESLAQSLSQSVSLTDDRARVVVINKAPQRVVSLLPSLGEIVCELKACDLLVGVDRYSNWPERVKSLPKLGGLDDTQLEALVKLKPDLVLLARSSRVTQRLESLGIHVLALEPQNQEDMQRVILTLARALHLPNAQERADELWRQIQKKLDATVARVPKAAKGARIYFEAGSGYFAAGESSFIGETLKRLGLVNVVGPSMGSFPQLNPEFVVKANPQIIFMGERAVTDLKSRPGWQRIEALQQQRVCSFTASESDIIVRSGPRIAEAAELMVDCLKSLYPT
jgi:iron complex transport system substrate-binding protein